ncbi:hypothetical protein PC123_g14719 [Phytophthora cactorum]|nr:hypothetical protein PC123_g14719 [Phytophthora cactorum]
MSDSTTEVKAKEGGTSQGTVNSGSSNTNTVVQAPLGGMMQIPVVQTTGVQSVAANTGGVLQPGVAGVAPLGQPGVQQASHPVIRRSKPLGSSKPPKFDDTFEVCQVRLKLYLQRDAWGVVTGAELRHETDLVLQRQFDDRDRLAMETIIRGVNGADIQKVCTLTTTKEMWDALTAKKTQRDFSYAVHLQREMFAHSYTPGPNMADYIQDMNSLRQRLQHMGPGFMITDTFMSQLLLMGVCAVHREIVTQFDFFYRQGKPPSWSSADYWCRQNAFDSLLSL